MLKRIKCECGVEITPNTWAAHLRGKHCNLSKSRKQTILQILKLKTAHKVAWPVSQGLDAIKDEHWFYSVIDGSKKLEDWTFKAPRPTGSIPPSMLKRFAIERTGSANPTVRANTRNYNVEELKSFAKMTLKSLQDGSCSFRELLLALEDQYPNFRYQFADIKIQNKIKTRGFNRENVILSHLLDIEIETLIKISHKMRGASISKGQLSSEKFLQSASMHAAKLISSLRVSRPQRILYNMILSVDSKASLEKPFRFDGVHKAFDVYSPAINAVIEMHGRVFHDPSKSKGKLIALAESNVKNDALKKALAESNGMKYLVFWDDECHLWQDRIKEIYNAESISYAKAKNKVDEADRKDAGL